MMFRLTTILGEQIVVVKHGQMAVKQRQAYTQTDRYKYMLAADTSADTSADIFIV